MFSCILSYSLDSFSAAGEGVHAGGARVHTQTAAEDSAAVAAAGRGLPARLRGLPRLRVGRPPRHEHRAEGTVYTFTLYTPRLCTITSFHGSSCANNGKGALN